MDSTYPVKLGLFAKSTKLTSVPFAPQGHVFGMVTSGSGMTAAVDRMYNLTAVKLTSATTASIGSSCFWY